MKIPVTNISRDNTSKNSCGVYPEFQEKSIFRLASLNLLEKLRCDIVNQPFYNSSWLVASLLSRQRSTTIALLSHSNGHGHWIIYMQLLFTREDKNSRTIVTISRIRRSFRHTEKKFQPIDIQGPLFFLDTRFHCIFFSILAHSHIKYVWEKLKRYMPQKRKWNSHSRNEFIRNDFSPENHRIIPIYFIRIHFGLLENFFSSVYLCHRTPWDLPQLFRCQVDILTPTWEGSSPRNSFFCLQSIEKSGEFSVKLIFENSCVDMKKF